jgi:pilus assembly protein CpaB
MKQKIIGIVSILIGILAFWLTANYLRANRQEIQKQWDELNRSRQTIEVMVAARDIPANSIITEDNVVYEAKFRHVLTRKNVFKDDRRVVLGRKTLFRLKQGEQILWDVIEGGMTLTDGASGLINKDKRLRAVSISVGGASAVSGLVRPGDHVDVLGTFSFPSKQVPGEMETATLTLLQDVTVLATGQETALELFYDRTAGRRPAAYSTVTLETTAREAELLVFAQQTSGRLTLTLRHPDDVSFEPTIPVIDFSYIQSKLEELNRERQRVIREKRLP